ncbi:MAG: hypothetical protein E6H58_16615 [Betaproteobacteria bacterium]|nr:MAG: hypothetical protein E6H58_16615 [Betaproteobacteria bacterium]
MRRDAVAFSVLAIALSLAACGERVQTVNSPKKADAKSWQGSENAAYTAAGWNPGDRTSWENQIHTRNQSQNEYNKVK